MKLSQRKALYEMTGGFPMQSDEKIDSFKVIYKSNKKLDMSNGEIDAHLVKHKVSIPGTDKSESKLSSTGKTLTIKMEFIGPKNDPEATKFLKSSMIEDVQNNFGEIKLKHIVFKLQI
jgi:hypothetical protein